MVQVGILQEFRDLGLNLVCGEEGLEREIRCVDLNRPGLEVAGCFEFFDEERIQIFGGGEMRYINTHQDSPALRETIHRIFQSRVPCVIITNDEETPDFLIEAGCQKKMPVFRTAISTTRLYKRLFESLEHFFCPTTLIHGTLVDILGMGILLIGQSGVGKSECALELVSKGHSLVADDVVRVLCLGERALQGSSPHLLRHYIEVRGLGIVDLSKLYGIRAVRREKQIDMVITLEEWKPETYVERVGLEQQYYSILGVSLPHLTIPVKPGRNLSTIVEVGARDQRLKLLGIHSAQDFNQKLMNMTRQKKSSVETLEEVL
ncbi:MAG: HPr(Ser) kinase/phosphatase [Candidatus Omnitrophica bacterium]|nr:MAG: HPr kinase/phosphorylase [Candidatus Hinthialibacteria bacterium OLB16]MBE7487864.1 HPr(Ser) kinase/phosphatase [bacterium]MBK7496955.1 HPr(Ser) kinase/phosphatase [Candidatus Omnitrophota bacterium]MCE7909117.1 HPr(Ser) kinase/phosphatase [Candidatus Omnitrophica bacterium COP1]MBV6481765.1 HPr kinase/phosphorylase [bacterium]